MPTIMTAIDARKQKYQAPPSAASVQARYMEVREVRHNVLCLRSTHPLAKREYRAVIEVQGVNYLLKAAEDQDMIDALYQRFLASLSFPIQILSRVQPLSVKAYLQRYEVSQEGKMEGGENPNEPRWLARSRWAWRGLADSHVQFIKQLASRRTLLERTFYVVIAADSIDAEQQKDVKRGKFLFSLVKRKQRSEVEEFERARQQLDLRCSEVARQLVGMGLRVQRLNKHELIRLEYSCLTPMRAREYPLHKQLIDGINHPVQIDPERVKHLRNAGKKQQLTKKDLEKIFTEAELDVARTAIKQQKLMKKHKSLALVELEPAIDFGQVSDLLAPSSIVLQSDLIYIEGEFARTLVVRQLPRIVSSAWLRPLAELDEPMEVSLHLRPLQVSATMVLLRRKQLEYVSSAMVAAEKGRIADPEMEVARGDVGTLIEQLASGEERMLDLSLHILVRGTSKRLLNERCDRIMSVLHTMLLMVRSATYEQDRGFRSCLPHARTELGRGLMLSSAGAATMFPFLANTLFASYGVMEGLTPAGEPVVLDWWSSEQRNANRIVIAPSGSGKSFKTKLDMMRAFLLYGKEMMQRSQDQRHTNALTYQIICIDPEREYKRLCEHLGGQWVRLAPGSVHHINPFELPRANLITNGAHNNGEIEHGDVLADHIQRLQALMDIMLADRTSDGAGTLTSQEKGLLDRALFETYRRVGIRVDPRTHQRPAPLMRDLYAVLESGICGPDPTGLIPRLRRFVHGSLAGIFDGATNVELDTPLVVFDVHDLDGELRPIAFFLISNHVWSAAFGSTIPRQLVVDELLSLYQYPEGARFLETLFQRGRKHYLGVTGITQHPALLVNSTIPSNCAVQILMAQEPSSLDLLREVFKLSDIEVQYLKICSKGDALLLSSDKRVYVHFEASEHEHYLATTDPRELARWQQAEQAERERTLLDNSLHSKEREALASRGAFLNASGYEKEKIEEQRGNYTQVLPEISRYERIEPVLKKEEETIQAGENGHQTEHSGNYTQVLPETSRSKQVALAPEKEEEAAVPSETKQVQVKSALKIKVLAGPSAQKRDNGTMSGEREPGGKP